MDGRDFGEHISEEASDGANEAGADNAERADDHRVDPDEAQESGEQGTSRVPYQTGRP